jgi:hypothetical protein
MVVMRICNKPNSPIKPKESPNNKYASNVHFVDILHMSLPVDVPGATKSGGILLETYKVTNMKKNKEEFKWSYF